MKENDFYNDLAFSVKGSEEGFWQAVYKKAFPNMEWAKVATANGQGQHLGIDRIIYLKSGKTLYIDEKKRRVKYDDILLEYHSNSTKPVYDGWMNKDLLIDYLAYAFMPNKKVYLLDWQSLQRAWRNNGVEWFSKARKKQDGFNIVIADNRYYKTYSIAVPIQTLLNAIYQPIIVDLQTNIHSSSLNNNALLINQQEAA